MIVETVPNKSKMWGVVPLERTPGFRDDTYKGHFHTGHVPPSSIISHEMLIGENRLLTGTLVVTGFERGRSAANIQCAFRGAEKVTYEMSIKGICDLLVATQTGRIAVANGGFVGRYTFAKSGENILLVIAEPEA